MCKIIKMNLSEFITSNNYTLVLDEINSIDLTQKISSRNRNIISFMIPTCKHIQTKRISYLANRRGRYECQECVTQVNYRNRQNIDIDSINSTVTCLECQTVYNRNPSKLLYNINLFKCYCKSQRDNEKIFYDLMYSKMNNIVKGFGEYGTSRNHSADFYVINKNSGRTYIIHLDDVSHTIKINQERDIYKLKLTNDSNGTLRNIYVHQGSFMKDKNMVAEKIKDIIYQDVDGVNNYWLSHTNPNFYHYMEQFMDAQKTES